MGMCVADSASFPGYFSLRLHDLGMRLYQEWLNQFINKNFSAVLAMATPPPWHQWQRRKPSRPNPTLVEVHEWVQPSHCHQDNQTLRHGQLLRWMDIAACLSGLY